MSTIPVDAIFDLVLRVAERLLGLTEAAGIGRRRFHDLRHTAASLLLAQGLQPKVISDILGHSGIGITLDIYAHVMPAAIADAAEKMGAVLER